MDKLQPETQEMLLLMEKIAEKQRQREEFEKNKKTTRAPDEVVELFRREQMDSLFQNVSVLTKATDLISEKDAKLKIVFCDAKQMHDKQKDGTARLCSVTSDRHDQLLDLVTSELPAGEQELDRAMKECDRLSVLMEKKSVNSTRTASELRNTLLRLERTMSPAGAGGQSDGLVE